MMKKQFSINISIAMQIISYMRENGAKLQQGISNIVFSVSLNEYRCVTDVSQPPATNLLSDTYQIAILHMRTKILTQFLKKITVKYH